MKTQVTIDRPEAKTVSAVAVLACAWPAVLLATVCLLPFLNKAFNIDDSWFLPMAQQIVKHPTHPMNFEVCWNLSGLAGECRTATEFAAGNPLLGQVAQGYVLVLTALGGAHEWMAHITLLLLVWIAVMAMASLTLRFGWDRWHATAGALLLVAIPPFLPMASTAMPDILATALALVAMDRIVAWKAKRKWSQGAVAAFALGLAGFARPHLVLLLPLAAFFLRDSVDPGKIVEQLRRELWLWIPVFAGLGLQFALILVLREHNLAHSAPSSLEGSSNIPTNLLVYLAYFAFPLPLAACWVATHLRGKSLVLVFILSASVVAALLLNRNLLGGVILAILGLLVLADLIFQALRRRDHAGLFLLLWILIPFPIVYYSHLPMKYLLPCLPAVILLCFRLLDGVSVRFARAAVLAMVVAGTGYSLLILNADADFANFGRDALARLIVPHVEAGEKVWYPGQYWSYWYAPLDGATLTYPGGPQPEPGDLLVVDVLAAGNLNPLTGFPHRTLVKTITHKYRFGRTTGAGRGLYSSGFGFWMWGFGEDDKDRFELWRID